MRKVLLVLIATFVVTVGLVTVAHTTGAAQEVSAAKPNISTRHAITHRPPPVTVAPTTTTVPTTAPPVTSTPTTVHKYIPPAPKPKYIPPVTSTGSGSVWDRMAICETGGRWNMVGSKFSGGLGFANSTWRAYGGLAYASNAGYASRAQQIIVAEKIMPGGAHWPGPGCSGYHGW